MRRGPKPTGRHLSSSEYHIPSVSTSADFGGSFTLIISCSSGSFGATTLVTAWLQALQDNPTVSCSVHRFALSTASPLRKCYSGWHSRYRLADRGCIADNCHRPAELRRCSIATSFTKLCRWRERLLNLDVIPWLPTRYDRRCSYSRPAEGDPAFLHPPQ